MWKYLYVSLICCRVTNSPITQWLKTAILFAQDWVDQEFGLGSAGWSYFKWHYLWGCIGRNLVKAGVFKVSSSLSPLVSLQQSRGPSYRTADFQDGRPALEITHHFCHILLVKIGPRASVDSKKRKRRPPLVGGMARSQCKCACGREDIIAASHLWEHELLYRPVLC